MTGAPKALFDTIKRLLGRGLTQREVDEINIAAGTRTTPDVPSEPEKPHVPQGIGVEGIDLIKAFEGCARKLPNGQIAAYPDPGTGGAPWTIGWGATGKGIGPGTVWSQAQADERLEADLVRYADEVKEALGSALPATSQAQFDALVSFHYNTGAIRSATLTRLHKAGLFDDASREFGRWVHAGGRVLPGLTRRRAAEAALYRGGM